MFRGLSCTFFIMQTTLPVPCRPAVLPGILRPLFADVLGDFCFRLRVSPLMVLLKMAVRCRVDTLSLIWIFCVGAVFCVLPCSLFSFRCYLLPCQQFLMSPLKQVPCTPVTDCCKLSVAQEPGRGSV